MVFLVAPLLPWGHSQLKGVSASMPGFVSRSNETMAQVGWSISFPEALVRFQAGAPAPIN